MTFRVGFAFDNMPLAGTPPVQVDLAEGGLGIDPVSALYYVSGTNTMPDVRNNSRISVGMTDGTTFRVAGCTSENGGTPLNQDNHTLHDTTTVIKYPVTSSAAVDAEARWDGWQDLGSTIQVDDLPAFAANLMVGMYFYDCPTKVVEFAGNATQNSSSSVSGLGFTPDMVISVSHTSAYAADGVDTGARRISVGVGVKTPSGGIQQVCFMKYCEAVITTTSYAAALHDDCIVSSFTDDADGAQLELTSWDSDGATFTTRRASASVSTALLFLKTDRRLWAGIPALVTSSTGIKSITDPGFPVTSYPFVFATSLATKNSTIMTSAINGWSIGGRAEGVGGGEFCVGGFESDGVGTCATRSTSHSKVARVLLDTTPTDDWIAAHSSFDSVGFSIDIEDASAADRLAAFVAIGDPIRIISDTETISDQTAMDVGLAVSDTETISDQFAIAGSLVVPADTEAIADETVFSATGNLVFSDTEEITDQTAMAVDMALAETVEIGESVILIALAADNLLLVLADSETISDETVFTGDGSLVLSDTVEILDLGNLAGDALLVVSDTETITDDVQQYLGNVIVVSDTEEITDELSTPLTATQTKGAPRGSTFQGGAEEGEAFQGGAERGTVL